MQSAGWHGCCVFVCFYVQVTRSGLPQQTTTRREHERWHLGHGRTSTPIKVICYKHMTHLDSLDNPNDRLSFLMPPSGAHVILPAEMSLCLTGMSHLFWGEMSCCIILKWQLYGAGPCAVWPPWPLLQMGTSELRSVALVSNSELKVNIAGLELQSPWNCSALTYLGCTIWIDLNSDHLRL